MIQINLTESVAPKNAATIDRPDLSLTGNTYDKQGVRTYVDDKFADLQMGNDLGVIETTDPAPSNPGIHFGKVFKAGTYINFKDASSVAIVVSDEDLANNFVFISVKNGVAKKETTVKPLISLKQTVTGLSTTDVLSEKATVDHVKLTTLTKEESTESGGKNLFDRNKIIEGVRIVTATGADFIDPKGAISGIIPVKGNTVYIISGLTFAAINYNYRFLDINGNFLHGFSGKTEDTDFAWSKNNAIRSHPDAVGFQFTPKLGGVGNYDAIQVEENSIATAYEPYIYKVKFDLLNLKPLSALYFASGGYVGSAQTLADLITTNKTAVDSALLTQTQNISTLNEKVNENRLSIIQATALAQSAISISASKISANEKGMPNGVATLGLDGKILASQVNLNGAILKGNWDASTNTPRLANGDGVTNNYYLVTADGTQNLGNGNITFEKGDTVIYSSGGKWLRNEKAKIPGLVSDVGLSEISQYTRMGDGLFNIYNENSKELMTFKKQEIYPNGIAITDTNIDGNLYRKIGNEFFANTDFLKSGRFSAKSYGCKMDGVSEDGVIFQKLIDTLTFMGGGIIDLPAGKLAYYNKVILAKDNVSIKGSGIFTSKFCPISTTTVNTVGGIYNTTQMAADGAEWNPLKNIIFEDFGVDCSGLHNVGTYNVGRKAFFILGMENCHFNRVHAFKSIGTGIGCDFLSRSSITNCLVTECGYYASQNPNAIGNSGIGIGSGSREDESVIVDGNWCIGNGNFGIFVEIQAQPDNPNQPQSNFAKIINNHCFGNKYGIGNKGSGSTIISGNTCYNNKSHGIYLYQSQRAGCLVINNDICYNGASGIACYGSALDKNKGDIIDGNRIHFNGEYGVNCNNSTVEKPWYNTAITNNKISNNGYSGILVNFNNYYFSVISNKIWNNGKKGNPSVTQGIMLRQSVGNVVRGNIIYDNQAVKTQTIGIGVYKKLTGDISTPVEVKDNSIIGYTPGNAITVETGVTEYIIKNNSGCENKVFGEASIADGTASINVVFDLLFVPKAVNITPQGNAQIWVSNVLKSGLTINRSETSGALKIFWSAEY